MTRTIHLMGRMGQLFGETHRLNCETVQEAMHALDCMKGGVRRYLLECTDTDVQFTVQKGEDFMDYDNIGHNLGEDDIIITPVPNGSGKGSSYLKIILGAILIYVGWMIGGAAGAEEGAKLAMGAGLFSTGMQLALSGIIELTMKDPDELKEEKSSLFNGPINTTKMGVPVPICYGKMEVGGAVTNFGFTQNRVKHQMGYVFHSKPGTSGGGGGYGGTGGGSGGTGGGGNNNVDWKQIIRDVKKANGET
jgi:predicted phage tail protein